MTNKRHAPTRKDVAREAGVSETIVSYALNNNRYVAEDKRRRVMEAVKKLNYQPNAVARSLRGKSSGHILFIADNIENEYFGRMVREIDNFAYDKGYIISLAAVRNNRDFISRILSRQVDAVIVSSSSIEEQYVQELVNSGVPVVLMMTRDYSTLTESVSRIYTGIESGIMAGVRYLYESGCRHLVHVDRVSSSNHFSSRRDLRYRGFCCQMEVLGFPLDENAFVSHCATHTELFDAICRRIRSGTPVDGFVCRNDQLACTVLAAVETCGRRIPQDISILGFDNASMSVFTRPRLSTIEVNRREVAKAAIEEITNLMSGGKPHDYHFTTQMILRETTR